jgi:hypothetical protein
MFIFIVLILPLIVSIALLLGFIFNIIRSQSRTRLTFFYLLLLAFIAIGFTTLINMKLNVDGEKSGLIVIIVEIISFFIVDVVTIINIIKDRRH